MTRLLILAWLAVSAAAAGMPKNAVTNAGFESGLELWNTAGGPDGIAIDSAVAHTGRQSVRLTGSQPDSVAGVHQFLDFQQPFEHTIRVSGWSQSQGVELGREGACAVFVDGKYADGTPLERQGVSFDPGAHDWQYREFTLDPRKPVKSLELVAILIRGKGTIWFDDLTVTPGPFAFRGVRVLSGAFGGPSVAAVADLSVKAPWKAELRGASGVVASASGDRPPVIFQWTGARGNYTLRLSATDALREETIEEVRKLTLGGTPPPRRYAAWVESSMKRVLPQALPGAAAEARFSLAGNEFESFQICLLAAPGSVIPHVRLEAGDLVAPGGRRIPAAEIEWQQVGYVPIDRLRRSAANEGAWAGWWPDPLLPVEQFALNPGFTQPVWVTLHAPAGTPAGEYSGAIRVLADGQAPLTVPVHARVYGFSLPAGSHLKTAFALLDAELEAIYGKPLSSDLRRKFGDFLLRHRLNADDIYRTELPDSADLAHFLARGLNAFNLLYLIPRNGALIPELSAYTPGLRRTLLERLSLPIPKLREQGMLKNAYVYGFDERDPEFFPVMRDTFGEIRQRYPELHTMTTAHIPLDPKVLKSLNVDWIVSVTPSYDYEKAEACRRAGLEVWGYVACDPREPYANFLADDPLMEARVLWWQAYQQKMDGVLYWGVNIWERRGNRRPIDLARGPLLDWGVTTGKAKDDLWLQELHGDGLLLYPGKDGPIGSIRLANLRDGLEDYEYLRLLGQRDACLPVTKDLTHFTLDPAVLYTQRDRIAKALAGGK
jgi:hypothetical protein